MKKLTISILENVKDIIFLRSEIIFEHQIWAPESSEIVRELNNITFNHLWKKYFFTPGCPIGGVKMDSVSSLKLISQSSYQDGSGI